MRRIDDERLETSIRVEESTRLEDRSSSDLEEILAEKDLGSVQSILDTDPEVGQDKDRLEGFDVGGGQSQISLSLDESMHEHELGHHEEVSSDRERVDSLEERILSEDWISVMDHEVELDSTDGRRELSAEVDEIVVVDILKGVERPVEEDLLEIILLTVHRQDNLDSSGISEDGLMFSSELLDSSPADLDLGVEEVVSVDTPVVDHWEEEPLAGVLVVSELIVSQNIENSRLNEGVVRDLESLSHLVEERLGFLGRESHSWWGDLELRELALDGDVREADHRGLFLNYS